MKMTCHSHLDASRASSNIKGFTLVELMVTLAIAAILLTMAVPSFSEFVKNNRLITLNNDLVTALNLARSEAIKRGDRVTVCKSSNQLSCSGSGSWDQGWIVFADVAGNGVVTDPATNIIRVHAQLSGNVTLKGDASLAAYVSYASNGATRQIGGGISDTQSGVLILCDDRGFTNVAKGIQVSSTGRVSSEAASATGAASCAP
jgi:type IV fimbrial biogenesis protein FimT